MSQQPKEAMVPKKTSTQGQDVDKSESKSASQCLTPESAIACNIPKSLRKLEEDKAKTGNTPQDNNQGIKDDKNVDIPCLGVHVFNPLGEEEEPITDEMSQNSKNEHFQINSPENIFETTNENGIKLSNFSSENIKIDKMEGHFPSAFHFISTVDENEEVGVEEEVLVDLPPPPDGGWGWVIVLASFVNNVIGDGIGYTTGILMLPLVQEFESDKSTVAWVGSLLVGICLLSGPIVAGLVNKFGCRIVCILGSILAASGLVLSTLSPNVTCLMISNGFIAGIGLGMVYLPSVIAVGYYFEKKRSLATGISVSGSGVGTFLFAPLATYLIEAFGWKGANRIFAGLILLCGLCGALMRPLELTTKSIDPLEEKASLETKTLSSGDHLQTKNPRLSLKPSSFQKGLNLEIVPEDEPTAELSSTRKEEHLNRSRRPAMRSISVMATAQNMNGSARARKISVPVLTGSSSVLPRSASPRFESSSPRFGRLARMNSNEPGSDPVMFGLLVPQEKMESNEFCLQPRKMSRKITQPIVRPMYRKDAFFSGSIQHLIGLDGEEKSFLDFEMSVPCRNLNPNDISERSLNFLYSVIAEPRKNSLAIGPNLLQRGSIVANHLSLPIEDLREFSDTGKDLLKSEFTLASPMLSVFKEMINFHILRQSLFSVLALSNVFVMLGFYIPFVFLKDMALTKGIPVEKANYLIAAIGAANVVGRIFIGWISDSPRVNALMVTNVALLFSGLSVIAMPLCWTYELYVVDSLIFGLCLAAFISLTSIVLVDLVGMNDLTSSFGLLNLFRGVSSMVGPPIGGLVSDLTGRADLCLFMAGGSLILGSLISFMVQFNIIKVQKQNKLKD